MELKDVSPMDWHTFKKRYPDIRMIFNSKVEEIKTLQEENDILKDTILKMYESKYESDKIVIYYDRVKNILNKENI